MAIKTIAAGGGAEYTSLAAAYAAADPGDILEIQDSEIYNEQLDIAKDNLTICSAAGCNPQIWHATYIFDLDAALTAFSILGTADNKIRLKATLSSADVIRTYGNVAVTAEYAEVSGNTSQRLLRAYANNSGAVRVSRCALECAAVFFSGNFTDLLLTECTGVCNILLSGPKTYSGEVTRNQLTVTTAIHSSGSVAFGTGLLFANNYILATNETAAQFFYPVVSGFSWQNNTVVCTAVAKNLDGFAFANFVPTGSELLNNIITGFDNGISHGNQAGACGDYNCLYGNVADYAGLATAGTHDVAADPKLTGYVIASDSPCIDTGTAAVTEAVDIDGTARPQRGGFDIGAYELGFAVSPLGCVDGSLRRATDIVGTQHPDPRYELVPADPTGALTDIRHLLMVWAGTDKYVPANELPADLRDAQFPDSRGWMADPDAGNRLWLFDRRALSNAVDEECRLMLTADLAWLVTDGIAASYTVAVTHTGRRRDVQITVKRLDGQLEKYGINDLWEQKVI